MSNDVTVTVAGFVGTTPKLFASQAGNDYTSFRVAHTRRQLDRSRGEWVDGRTMWFTVKAWRHLARNVTSSVRKGDPVVVTGRLAVDEWVGQDGPRTDLVVEATALGPDLTRGEAPFRHTVHRVGAPDADARQEDDFDVVAEPDDVDVPDEEAANAEAFDGEVLDDEDVRPSA